MDEILLRIFRRLLMDEGNFVQVQDQHFTLDGDCGLSEEEEAVLQKVVSDG